MAVYIIMTIISMLFAGYAQNVKEVESLDSTYRILGVMAFLPFAVVSALRYQVGTDWPIYNDYLDVYKRQFDEIVKLDVSYIDEWSLGLDIKILIKTVFVVLKRKGAY